jgi:hypothetical protein
MSLPYQIADVVDFDILLGKGLTLPEPIAQGNEPLENTLDVLLRSDPRNESDNDDPSTWIYIGNSTRQDFPLRANESVNLRVTRRNTIYFRGPLNHKLHVISARLFDMNAPR